MEKTKKEKIKAIVSYAYFHDKPLAYEEIFDLQRQYELMTEKEIDDIYKNL